MRVAHEYTLDRHTQSVSEQPREECKNDRKKDGSLKCGWIGEADSFYFLEDVHGVVVWSKIVNHFGWKSGAQGIQHREDIDDFLYDGATHRTEMAGSGKDHADHA